MTKHKPTEKHVDTLDPRTVLLQRDQLEKLADLEAAAYLLWEDVTEFNKEIGNYQCVCNECREKLKKNE